MVKDTLSIGPQDSLKVLFTTNDGGKAKRAHQTFLQLLDPSSELETSFPLQVKDNGKAKIDLVSRSFLGHVRLLTSTFQAAKDIPIELLSASGTLQASILIASLGTSKPYKASAFDLAFENDAGNPLPKAEKPLRYGKFPEIHAWSEEKRKRRLAMTRSLTTAGSFVEYLVYPVDQPPTILHSNQTLKVRLKLSQSSLLLLL